MFVRANRGRTVKRLLAVVLVMIMMRLCYNGLSDECGEKADGRVRQRPGDIGGRVRQRPGDTAGFPDNGNSAHAESGRLRGGTPPPMMRSMTATPDRDTGPEPLELDNTTDIDTVVQFSRFQFQPNWIHKGEYWDDSFDERYEKLHEDVINKIRHPLKIIVVPHSHNDPGWLKTFEHYYYTQSVKILNHMVEKLPIHKNMTFIWTEISLLAMWWESAHPTKKKVFQQLLTEGRLEITTGGWVMTDEATPHIYSMVDQLIEGHQWIKNNLGITINTGWSVDPFGHGPTVPYLLRKSEIMGGTVIQRIHYAWKEWFARTQNGDFFWRQNWDRTGHTDTLVHNMPFDIYSTKRACGPHPKLWCWNFDFRNVPGDEIDRNELSEFINDQNIIEKADLLVKQYGRTASLSPYNVAMIPLGDDFRFDYAIEWDQQYINYQKLFEYINANKDKYHGAEVNFGTPSDFFKELRGRSGGKLHTLHGDFFVYSDVYVTGRLSHWSGYYTTRPYWKVMDRELEGNLRSAEILYTIAINDAIRNNLQAFYLLKRNYERLVRARRNFALFKHHDAITGTSTEVVMNDYALKLYEATQYCVVIQSYSIQSLLSRPGDLGVSPSMQIVKPNNNRQTYDQPMYMQNLDIDEFQPRNIIVFNSHGRQKTEPIKILVSEPNVRVVDSDGIIIHHQVSPVHNFNTVDKQSFATISKVCFVVLFIALLEPLSLTTFIIQKAPNPEGLVSVYCNNCTEHSVFKIDPIRPGDIKLENQHLRVLFDEKTGLLSSIVNKNTGISQRINISFAGYQSANTDSGAYLFLLDPYLRETEKKVLEYYPDRSNIIITSGPLSSEITVIHSVITHTVKLYHHKGVESKGLYIENLVDFGRTDEYQQMEMFMRLSTDINNGNPAVIYTDSNGFQMQKRVTVKRAGIESNYYPVTSMAYIEDENHRLSVLVNHAQGVAGWEPGRIELMLDRQTCFDDLRGLNEAVKDNKLTLTKYWILLETVSDDGGKFYEENVSNPSLVANHLSEGLTYPANVFIVEPEMEHFLRPVLTMIDKPMACDMHLMNFRTNTDPVLQQFPSNSALMVLHRKGFDSRVDKNYNVLGCLLRQDKGVFDEGTTFARFNDLLMTRTTLTGIRQLETLDSFDQLEMTPMDLSVLNITFPKNN